MKISRRTKSRALLQSAETLSETVLIRSKFMPNGKRNEAFLALIATDDQVFARDTARAVLAKKIGNDRTAEIARSILKQLPTFQQPPAEALIVDINNQEQAYA